MFSPEVISLGLNGSFKDGHAGSGITVSDTWSRQAVLHAGTNSANTKKFDVAVYNAATVESISVHYISQLAAVAQQAAAYTDHMGLLVKVDKKTAKAQ